MNRRSLITGLLALPAAAALPQLPEQITRINVLAPYVGADNWFRYNVVAWIIEIRRMDGTLIRIAEPLQWR